MDDCEVFDVPPPDEFTVTVTDAAALLGPEVDEIFRPAEDWLIMRPAGC